MIMNILKMQLLILTITYHDKISEFNVRSTFNVRKHFVILDPMNRYNDLPYWHSSAIAQSNELLSIAPF